MRSINVIERTDDPVLLSVIARGLRVEQVDSLADVRAVLERLATAPNERPRSLDLMGHSIGSSHLLQLGTTLLDMEDPAVEQCVREIARADLLARLEVTSVRLLACDTAVEPHAQRTLRRLSRALGVPVFGTVGSVLKSHYDASGFIPAFDALLVDARALPNPPRRLRIHPGNLGWS